MVRATRTVPALVVLQLTVTSCSVVCSHPDRYYGQGYPDGAGPSGITTDRHVLLGSFDKVVDTLALLIALLDWERINFM